MKNRGATNPPPVEADLKRLEHDLEVHQVELESQNESLVAPVRLKPPFLSPQLLIGCCQYIPAQPAFCVIFTL